MANVIGEDSGPWKVKVKTNKMRLPGDKVATISFSRRNKSSTPLSVLLFSRVTILQGYGYGSIIQFRERKTEVQIFWVHIYVAYIYYMCLHVCVYIYVHTDTNTNMYI